MSYRRVQREKEATNHCMRFGHSLWSAISCQRKWLNSQSNGGGKWHARGNRRNAVNLRRSGRIFTFNVPPRSTNNAESCELSAAVYRGIIVALTALYASAFHRFCWNHPETWSTLRVTAVTSLSPPLPPFTRLCSKPRLFKSLEPFNVNCELLWINTLIKSFGYLLEIFIRLENTISPEYNE